MQRPLLATGHVAEEAGVEAGLRRMQLDTLRLVLIKIGGRVRQLLRKIRLHLASGHPSQRMWQRLSSASSKRGRE